MKQFHTIIFLLAAFFCGNIMLQAAPLDPDTLNCYVIDSQSVDQFDGSQLEGKKIVSYRMTTVSTSPDDVIRVHYIRTEGKTGDPIYVIDGKKVSKRKFENLSPSVIKSLTVVKNGSVEEVRKYPGWENGVILVETTGENPDFDTKDSRIDIGYGVADKRDISYSISSVKPDENEFYTNMYEYLRGKVAGVEVRPDNSIFIRGHNSMYSSMDPLILVDGTEITDLSVINPMDVYSIDVLKDASSAIYGMKGANGVILITTKAGQQVKEKEAAAKRQAQENAKSSRKNRKNN